MNERIRLRKIINVLVLIGILFLASCTQNPEVNGAIEEPIIVGGGVRNLAVLNGDTLYEGGWETGLKSIEVNEDTVIYDCSHLFHGYYWRWCGDSLFELDIDHRVSYLLSSLECHESPSSEHQRDLRRLLRQSIS